ncbi:unnamed protein product [Effrenium voratum]|nr:unnamed protein product [Effrenium voratum]
MGEWQPGLAALAAAREQLLRSNVISFNAALSSCRWQKAQQVFGRLSQALRADVISQNSLMNACGKAAQWPLTLGVLEVIKATQMRPTAITYNTAMAALKWREALVLLPDGDQGGCNALLGGICDAASAWREALALARTGAPSAATWTCTVSACAKAARWRFAQSLLQASSGSVYAGAALVKRPWRRALDLLKAMCARALQRSVVTCSSCITCLAEPETARWQVSLGLLDDLQVHEVEPNVITCNAAMSVCEKAEQWQLVLWLLRGFRGSPVSFNTAISACARCGRWQQALALLHTSQRLFPAVPDLSGLNAAITACEKAAQWPVALQLLEEARRLDVVSVSACVSCLEKALQWQRALRLFFLMADWRLRANVITCNAAISACEKCEQWQFALLLLQAAEMDMNLDVISFNASISACENASQWPHALALLSRLLRRRVAATVVTFNVTISACQGASKWQEALALFGQAQGLQPNVITFNAALRALEAAARWPSALYLLEIMDARRLVPDALSFQAAVAATGPGNLQTLRLLDRLRADMRRFDLQSDL